MYAVVTTGGRQYRVSPGDTIDVEKLTGTVGETVTVTNVQLVGQGAEVIVGAPAVAGLPSRVSSMTRLLSRASSMTRLLSRASSTTSPRL